MPRLFFAIEVTESLRNEITHVVQQLKKQLKMPIHWSPPENWHITIRFLGSTPEEKVTSCIEQAQRVLQSIKPFELMLGKLTVFPAGHPRVLGIQVPLSSELAGIYEVIEETMVALGFKAEPRRFSPHITLAKFKQPLQGSALVSLGAAMQNITIAPQSQIVDRVVLFESQTKEEGSVYRIVKKFVLGNSC